MSVVVCLKVNDGVVLAADSAATIGSPRGIAKVYFNASKICNLRKPLPIGFASCGIGHIGNASITTLAKDLRVLFTTGDQEEWRLDEGNYCIEEVVKRVDKFFGEQLQTNPPSGQWSFECIVAGYSAAESFPRAFQMSWRGNGANFSCHIKELWKDEPAGLIAMGAPEVLSRLISGFSPMLGPLLATELGLEQQRVMQALATAEQKLRAPLFHPAMPIQDAIDLCYYLVKLVVDFEHFTPGLERVGGPVEVAAITKHEGFKWVRRKHYYRRELNPEVGK